MPAWCLRSMVFVMLVFAATLAVAQKGSISGKVVDSKNQPIIGASILVKGTSNGAATDINGVFKLDAKPGVTLVVSYVGYKTSEVVATGSSIEVVLNEDSEQLNEIVVIGYGSVKRKDVTTSISSVSTKDMDQRPIVSATQAIQGKAAGVSVMQPSGQPGGEMSIRVRGTTSFNGSNDPLYVVDGVPVDNIKFLSPNDIADIQILKDASSASIYGSRAANGVILLTTKTGRSDTPLVTFNGQVGINKVSNSMHSLNAAQYKELQDEIGIVHLPNGLTDVTNWFDEAYTTGVTQNYQVSISNGNDKTKYYLSGGYTDEQGILKVAFYKRYNFRANIDNQVRKWLNVNANVVYSDYTSNGLTTGLGSNRGGVVLSVINTPTYAPVWDPAHPNQYYNNFYGVSNISNPLENMARSKDNKSRENRILASGSATIKFTEGLNFKSTLSLDRRNGLATTFLDPITTSWGRNQYGEGSDNRNMNTVTTFDNVLTYNTKIKNHAIEAMAGSSWTSSEYTNSWINGSHYRSDQIQTLNAANKISWDGTGTGGSEWAIMSYFGRLSYNYNSKYMVTANVRADGSSKLHPDHRWGYFPSASAAWRISSEDFMSNIRWISDLKLRGGWGQTGNQSGIGDYAYLQRYDITRVAWFVAGQENALPTINQANLRTPDLTWEKTTQTTLGLDLAMFNRRISMSLEYYYKRTTDMLMNVSLPAGAAAASSITRNEGEMTNKGVELSLNTVNLTGKLTWNTDFNISFNRNKLVKLDLQKIYYDGKTSDYTNEEVVRNEPGRSLGGFYGYISDGVDPETGELMYRDINKDGKISSSDRTYIGNPNPDFTFGMTNNFSWKNINLSILLQGSYGNDIFNASRIETEGMYDGKNQSTRVLDRWRIPGQITDIPKANFDLKNSTYFVEDGSYLRVKDISLSYSFTSALLKRWGVRKVQPYFTASNLITWTKYKGMDPEVNQWGNSGAVQGIDWGTYPHSKTFVFGVNVEF